MRDTEVNWLTREEVIAFVGDNADPYLRKWEAHLQSPYKGWNWAAAFFRLEWMVYRKMYLEAFLIWLSIFAVGMGGAILARTARVRLDDTILNSVAQILIGLLGNTLYHRKALRALRKTQDMTQNDRVAYLQRKGGTSVLAVVLMVVLELASILLL